MTIGGIVIVCRIGCPKAMREEGVENGGHV